jgi:hypothetical protein
MADVEVIDFAFPWGPGHVLHLPGIEKSATQEKLIFF